MDVKGVKGELEVKDGLLQLSRVRHGVFSLGAGLSYCHMSIGACACAAGSMPDAAVVKRVANPVLVGSSDLCIQGVSLGGDGVGAQDLGLVVDVDECGVGVWDGRPSRDGWLRTCKASRTSSRA
jgi:hypothetical protein